MPTSLSNHRVSVMHVKAVSHPITRKSKCTSRRRKRTHHHRNFVETEPLRESRKDRIDVIRSKNTMKFLPGVMDLFHMRWCKKHADCTKDDDDSLSLDPLSVIIEEAKNANCPRRVRLVRFNLDRNEFIDEFSQPLNPSTRIICQHTFPKTSILSPSTTSTPRKASEIRKFLKNINFDPECDAGDATNVQLGLRGNNKSSDKKRAFKEDIATSSRINELILKGSTQQKSYNYPKAAKYFLQASTKLDHYSYPPEHTLWQIANKSISDTHHAHKSLEHSANIVKFGLSHESKGQLVKALKMYTIAFRIRKQSLGSRHPSLPVLLNLLGGVQVKRGQYQEAMQIFELALYGKLKSDTKKLVGERNVSATTLAVSMREIGSIHEHFGRFDEAMAIHHDSLDLAMKDAREVDIKSSPEERLIKSPAHPPSVCSTMLSEESYDICVVSASSQSSTKLDISSPEEMEIYLQETFSGGVRSLNHLAFFYDSFFQRTEMKCTKMNIHVATTLHNIASIHLKQREFNLALSAYHAALRGMTLVHGDKHESVAAVLGNIGNLLKEIKDYDRAFEIYQSVLKMESLRLGFAHHNVMITMLNIAMIEKCRGRYDASIALYKEVISIQQNRREHDDPKVIAVALSCLGDVFEKTCNFDSAISVFKEALAVQSQSMTDFDPGLGKILQKLGILCSQNGQLRHADTYYAKALRLYQKNGLTDQRVIEVQRNKADNLSKLSGTPSSKLT